MTTPINEAMESGEKLAAYVDRMEAKETERLRDHFAGLAMQAIYSEASRSYQDDPNAIGPPEFPSIAEDAYRLADAMLKARTKPEKAQ